ncbi:MAG: hypothetical protein J6575_03705 [Bifidobacterium sp.]|nr:hypothetical protein [Bifidobacterium sp.]
MNIIPSIISGVISIAIAVVGWVITWRSSVHREDMIKADAVEKATKRSEDLDNMAKQVKALQDQADAAKRQAELAERRSDVPEWSLEQVKNLMYALHNGNAFTAKNVRIEFPDTEEGTRKYELGDIDPGSSQTFMFMEMGIWGQPDQVQVVWSGSDGKERHITLPVS